MVGGPCAFSRLSKENGVEWLRFHHTTTTALPFSRSATLVILWRRFRRFRWFGWFPLPNLKLLEFFSFSPLLADYGGRRRRKRLRQTERRKRRKRFAASATIIDSLSLSLPSFLQSIFVPFAISKRGKQEDGSFPSILIIVVRDIAP